MRFFYFLILLAIAAPSLTNGFTATKFAARRKEDSNPEAVRNLALLRLRSLSTEERCTNEYIHNLAFCHCIILRSKNALLERHEDLCAGLLLDSNVAALRKGCDEFKNDLGKVRANDPPRMAFEVLSDCTAERSRTVHHLPTTQVSAMVSPLLENLSKSSKKSSAQFQLSKQYKANQDIVSSGMKYPKLARLLRVLNSPSESRSHITNLKSLKLAREDNVSERTVSLFGRSDGTSTQKYQAAVKMPNLTNPTGLCGTLELLRRVGSILFGVFRPLVPLSEDLQHDAVPRRSYRIQCRLLRRTESCGCNPRKKNVVRVSRCRPRSIRGRIVFVCKCEVERCKIYPSRSFQAIP